MTSIMPASPMRCQASPMTSGWSCSSVKFNVDLTGPTRHDGTLVQAARGQAHAQPVVHQNLESVGSLLGNHVGVMRAGGTEGLHHARERRVGPGTHVHRLPREPDLLDMDHVSTARAN